MIQGTTVLFEPHEQFKGQLSDRKIKYNLGAYNKWNDEEQWVRISEGCPNQCPYCYEPKEFKVFGIPEIIRNKVEIMDMNLLAKPEALSIIKGLGEKKVGGKVVHYHCICGIDYRFLTKEIAEALKESRFKDIHIAWDFFYKEQYKIKDALDLLVLVGYERNSLSTFMICNWKIPFEENCLKLDLLKVWNVKANDCWYDNQVSPKIEPIYWTGQQIKSFRKMVRHHNQIVNFRIDPEVRD